MSPVLPLTPSSSHSSHCKRLEGTRAPLLPSIPPPPLSSPLYPVISPSPPPPSTPAAARPFEPLFLTSNQYLSPQSRELQPSMPKLPLNLESPYPATRPLSQSTHLPRQQQLALRLEGQHVAANDGSARLEGENRAVHRLTAALRRDEVGDLAGGGGKRQGKEGEREGGGGGGKWSACIHLKAKLTLEWRSLRDCHHLQRVYGLNQKQRVRDMKESSVKTTHQQRMQNAKCSLPEAKSL